MRREEGGGCQDNHRTIDSPPHEHREEGIEKFKLQGSLDTVFVFLINLSTLHQLAMQKQVVRHHHRSQYRHYDKHAALWDARHHPPLRGGRPIYPNQEELIDKRQAYHRDKGNDEPFNALIGVGKEEDESAYPMWRIFLRSLAEAQSRDDAQVSHIMLQGDEHDGGERNHPEQHIAV